MAQDNYITTTIRIPVPFFEEIKKLSAEVGDSQNGTMLHLLHFGMKIYRGIGNVAIKPEDD